MITDDFRHKGLRSRLVDELRRKGAGSETVLKAINSVPRHLFLDSSFVKIAYSDVAFPIGAGQTISQPSTVARQTTLLNVSRDSRVLEVGTGSGYQAAVLSEMGVEVYTIERQAELYRKTAAVLRNLGYSDIKTYLGDGYEGLPDQGPFDAILVTAGAAELPQKLLLQMKVGAAMVIPLGRGTQIMTRIWRISEDEFEKEEFEECAFVPMLNGIAR